MVTGSTLQEDIAAVARRLLLQGRNILGLENPPEIPPRHDSKTIAPSGRLREVPPSFTWVDHRLVREGYIERCDCTALALYLFLVAVSDVQGLSFYSEASLCRRLKIDPFQLANARAQLEKAGLVAYRKPLYQVLSLEAATLSPTPAAQRAGQTLSVADIFKRLTPGGGQ
jgi:hypothetical protein